MLTLPPDVLNRVSDAIIIVDSAFRCRFMNRRAGTVFGCDPAAMVGRELWAEFPAAAGSELQLSCVRALEQQVAIDVDTPFPRSGPAFHGHVAPADDGLVIHISAGRRRPAGKLRPGGYGSEGTEGLEDLAALLEQLDADAAPWAAGAAPVRTSEQGTGFVVWLHDVERDRIVYADPPGQPLFGLDSSALRQRPASIMESVHADDHAAVAAAMLRAPAESVHAEYRVVAPDGSTHWASTTSRPLRHATNGKVYVAGVTRDITEERRLREQVRASARQRAALVEISRRVLMDDDAGTLLSHVVSSTARALELDVCGLFRSNPGEADRVLDAGFGWHGTASDLRLDGGAGSLLDAVAAGGASILTRAAAAQQGLPWPGALRDNGIDWIVAVRIPAPAEEAPVLLAGCAQRRPFSDDEVHFLQSVSGLVAHYMRTHTSRREQRRLAAALHATSDIVALGGADGQLSFLNAAGRRILGVDVGEDISKIVAPDLFAGHYSRQVDDATLPASGDAVTWSGESVLRGGAGAEVPVSAVVLTQRDADGSRSWALLARDLTAQKRNEEVLLRRAEQLQDLAQAASEIATARSEQDLLRVLLAAAGQLTTGSVAAAGYAVRGDWDSALVFGRDMCTGGPDCSRGVLEDAAGRFRHFEGFMVLPDLSHAQLDHCSGGVLHEVGEQCVGVRVAVHGTDPGELLIVLRRRDTPFSPDEEALLLQLAWVAAIALRDLQLHQELTRAEKQYRAFFENDITADFALLPDGTISTCNPTWLRMFGFDSLQHALGTSILQLHLDPALLDDVVEQVHTTGQVREQETELVRLDGTPLSVVFNAFGIFDDAGELVEIRGYLMDVTERKRAEQELRRSEEMFRELAENIDAVFWVRDPTSGRLQYVSPASERILGIAANHLLSDHRRWPRAVQRSNTTAAPAHGDGAEVTREYRIITPDGNLRWLRDRMYPVRDDRGQLLRTVGFTEDVTAAVRAQSELQESQDRLGGILDSAMDAVVSIDATDRIILFNRAAEHMTGCTAADVLGTHVARFIPERLRYAYEQELKAFRRGTCEEPARSRALRALRADGTEFPIEASFSQLETATDSIFTVIARDVTERERAEAALRRTEERYRSFFDEDLAADYLADAAGTILECNPSFARTFGFEIPEQARGRALQDFYANPEDRGRIEQMLRSLRRIEGLDLSMRRDDGSAVYAVMNVVADFSADGDLLRERGYIFDMTEHRQLQEQLRESQKLEAVGRLAGGVAHDFNNMLAAITGFAGLLAQDLPATGAERLYVGEIQKAADRAARLTRQLLAFGRKQALQPRVVDLNRTVEGSQELLKRLLGPGINVLTLLDPDLWHTRVDPHQFEQVLMNLAVNARDAMGNDGTLRITTMNRTVVAHGDAVPANTPPGRYVQMSVSDTGSGMHDEIIKHIFEPFFTTKPLGQGTGLGLATVHGIISQSGGHVWAENSLTGGATFHILVPAVYGACDADIEMAADVYLPTEQCSETVLLVDDEPAVRLVAKRVLERAGYRVLEAGDGVEALDIHAASWQDIQLVVTDVAMPNMGGRLLADRLRASRADLPILFTSGFGGEVLSEDGTLPEATSFVQKPFTPAALLGAVRAALDSRGAVRP
jgi:two-component system, cell cycle sensor histidine kinase and response regulator CckA